MGRFGWYMVGWYWLMYDVTGSIEDGTWSVDGGTGRYLVVLGQYRAVRVDI